MSITAGSSIYTGVWTNWSRGPILGATITLTQRNGSLLTAFLGIFVTIAGGASWRILSFLIHQHRAGHDRKDKDALHYQQQVILRNSDSSAVTAWQMMRFTWDKRKLGKKQILRNLSFFILALCNTLVFAVAGVFSSSVTKAVGTETLITSSHCGYTRYGVKPDVKHSASTLAWTISLANGTFAAIMYSRACYGETSNELQCGRFPQSQLASTSEMNVSCPFQSHICLDGPNTAFRVESQWIDTNNDLGINSKVSDRIQYRKVTTCSVLRTTGYIVEKNATKSSGDPWTAVIYSYGSFLSDNYTVAYDRQELRTSTGYSLSGYLSKNGSRSTGWTPIPELIRTDADVTLTFLVQSGISYEAPVRDPWFMATMPLSVEADSTENITLYKDDSLPHVLGCADQFQLCTQAHTKCTPLTGSEVLPDAVTALQLNDVQKDIASLLCTMTELQPTHFTVNARGRNALRVSDTMLDSDGIQVGLPKNQWMIEIAYWFDISMARLQQQIVTFATGPPNIDKDQKFVPGARNACGRQKIHNTAGFTSFSVLGISIIFIIGGLLILISLVLDQVIGYFRKNFNWKDYKRLQWISDEQLELQQLAYPTRKDVLLKGGESSEETAISLSSDRNAVSHTHEE